MDSRAPGAGCHTHTQTKLPSLEKQDREVTKGGSAVQQKPEKKDRRKLNAFPSHPWGLHLGAEATLLKRPGILSFTKQMGWHFQHMVIQQSALCKSPKTLQLSMPSPSEGLF